MTPTTGTSRTVVLLLALTVFSGVVADGATSAPSAVAPATAQDDLSAEVVTYDGEVALQDDVVRVRGRAPGYRRVVVAFVDRGAGTVAVSASVGENGTFREDVPLRDADGRLGGGDAQGFVLSPGGDRVFGGTGRGPDTVEQFVGYVRNLERRGLTDTEVVERVRQESVDAAGSDDVAVEIPFRLTDARTEIRTVGPEGVTGTDVSPVAPGGTMVVSGVTNRRPDVANVSVRVTEGPSEQAFPDALVTEWGEDGVWTVELRVPGDANTGTYTVEASDDVDADSVAFEVTARTPTPTTSPTTTPSPSPTAPLPTPVARTPRPARPTRTALPPPTTAGRPPGGLLPRGAEIFVGVFLVSIFAVGLVLFALGRRRRHPPRL